MIKNNTEEIEFLAEAHGVVFPIKDFDYSDIELLSNEEVEKRYLEYMGIKCNTLFIDKTKLPRKMRVCFDEFGFDRVIVFSDFVNANDEQKITEIWELIFRMMTDFCVSEKTIKHINMCSDISYLTKCYTKAKNVLFSEDEVMDTLISDTLMVQKFQQE